MHILLYAHGILSYIVVARYVAIYVATYVYIALIIIALMGQFILIISSASLSRPVYMYLDPFHVHLDPFHVYLDPYKLVSILIG